MKVPNRVYARRHLRVDSRHFYAWKNNKAVPDGAILHWDADYSAGRELTRYGHKLESLVLGNQYQLQADGSTINIGATMPVDTIAGEKWLRSCGAVTNLLPSGSDNFVTGWTKRGNAQLTTVGNEYLVSALKTVSGGELSDLFIQLSIGSNDKYTPGVEIKRVSQSGILRFANPQNEALGRWDINFALLGNDYEFIHENHTAVTVVNKFSSIAAGGLHFKYYAQAEALPLSFYVRNPILTATSYPVPYVPPGVTQPASNATTTNGSWFSLPDGSPLWQALTGQPLTLATRVRMGVGSGDLVDGTYPIASEKADNSNTVQMFTRAIDPYPVASRDGTANVAVSPAPWPRNAIIRRFTQVNTAGTQSRVGYAIEGTHTTIQWSSWVNYDSSFNPSTLYRLLLGFNNAYPMWFNKITAWRKQVSDTEIMEALS